MYTESEARPKLCPQAMNSQFANPGCAGSLCMAWRLSYPKQVDGQIIPTGYCGLAGEPKR